MARLTFAFLLAIALGAGLMLPAVPANAQQGQSSCECFCRSDEGTIMIGRRTASDCRTECQETVHSADGRFANANGMGMSVCARIKEQYPESLRCYERGQDEGVCANQGGFIDTDYQPPECLPGWHYCYQDPEQQEPINLSVDLGGITHVQNVTQYIDTFYTLLLRIAGTIATVFIIIGGLQYTLGSATQEQISKGKERIKNGVIGLVILLGAVLLLETVNPQLINLQPPQFPLVKTVTAAFKPCEDLEEEGYELEDPGEAKVCGVEAKVLTDPEGNDVVAGTTCSYTTCPGNDPFERCVNTGDGAKCLRCQDLYPENPQAVKPTAALCEAFNQQEHIRQFEEDGNYFHCFYSKDYDVRSFQDESLSSLFRQGTCAYISENEDTEESERKPFVACNRIQRCSDYGRRIQSLWIHAEGDHDEIYDVEGIYAQVCDADPCDAALKEQGGGCFMYEEDCRSAAEVTRIQERRALQEEVRQLDGPGGSQ